MIHDPTLDRTTEGQGLVADKTAAELAATKLRDGGGEGVPTLDEVLDVFAGSAIELHIEIKTDANGRLYRGLEQRLVDVIAQRKLQEHRDPDLLRSQGAGNRPRDRAAASGCWLRSTSARRTQWAASQRRSTASRRSMAAWSPSRRACWPTVSIYCLESLGRERLGAWVPNEPEDIAAWLARPIRQITTDRPDLALEQRRVLTARSITQRLNRRSLAFRVPSKL